jgi:hypothetical protein
MPQPNSADPPVDDNHRDATVGCTTAFLYYLNNQRNFNIQEIIQAGAETLADIYSKLTCTNDGWHSFIDLVNLHYPQTVTYSIQRDQIFPVANLSFLSSMELVAGTIGTISLGLDSIAWADIQVDLQSENPAVVSIPSQIRFTPGTITLGIPANVAPITGPSQTVNIFATYAGTTLSATVTVQPAASIFQGYVTDNLSNLINHATILCESDIVIIDGSGDTLQVTTGSQTISFTPPVTPVNYGV